MVYYFCFPKEYNISVHGEQRWRSGESAGASVQIPALTQCAG